MIQTHAELPPRLPCRQSCRCAETLRRGALLRYLAQKDKPYWYIDTHAGAGCYSLDSAMPRKMRSMRAYCAVVARDDLPAPLASMCAGEAHQSGRTDEAVIPAAVGRAGIVARAGQDAVVRAAPDRQRDLQENFAGHGSRADADRRWLWRAESLLPPPPRRALVLIDPPYEDKQDYQRVVSALREGLKRFAGGVYACWYPQLQRAEARQLPEQLKQLPVKSWFACRAQRAGASEDGFGMHAAACSSLIHRGVAWRVAGGDALSGQSAGQNGEGGFVLEFEENA